MENVENSDINFLFKLLDKNQEHLLIDVQAFILNKENAIKAVDLYNKYYFAKIPASISFKSKLANQLIDLCKKFNVESNLWKQITDKNATVIEFIDICKNKQNFV